MKPARLVSIAAIIPVFFSVLGMTLSNAAAPSTPFIENPITLLNCFILLSASILFFLPRVLKWGWDTKYFGVMLFHISSISLIFIVPCLCLVLYSTLTFYLRVSIFIIFGAIHAIWCRRFVNIYRKIYNDPMAINLIYQEENDAFYYMQRADKHILERKYKFLQLPKDRYFVISCIISFLLLGCMETIKGVTGLPFIHTFLLINTLPISIMAAGLVTKSWLVYYYYPLIIKRHTEKNIYVDMSGKFST
jgi:hypothetical protein